MYSGRLFLLYTVGCSLFISSQQSIISVYSTTWTWVMSVVTSSSHPATAPLPLLCRIPPIPSRRNWIRCPPCINVIQHEISGFSASEATGELTLRANSYHRTGHGIAPCLPPGQPVWSRNFAFPMWILSQKKRDKHAQSSDPLTAAHGHTCGRDAGSSAESR